MSRPLSDCPKRAQIWWSSAQIKPSSDQVCRTRVKFGRNRSKSVEVGPKLVKLAPALSNSGRLGPNLIEIKSVEVGPNLTELRPDLAQQEQSLGRCDPNFAEFGSNLVEVCPKLVEASSICSKPGQNWLNFADLFQLSNSDKCGRVPPDLGPNWQLISKSSQTWSTSAQIRFQV